MKFSLTKPLIVCTLLFASCSLNRVQEPPKVVDGGKFSITLPRTYQVGQQLHNFAPLQLENPKHAVFLLGMSEQKEDLKEFYRYYSVTDYSEFVLNSLSMRLHKQELESSSTFKINGLDCVYSSIAGEAIIGTDTVDLKYYVAVMEGENYFHQLVSWSPMSNASHVDAEMKHIVCSFNEHSSSNQAKTTLLAQNKQ